MKIFFLDDENVCFIERNGKENWESAIRKMIAKSNVELLLMQENARRTYTNCLQWSIGEKIIIDKINAIA